jgi:hypothetical protein
MKQPPDFVTVLVLPQHKGGAKGVDAGHCYRGRSFLRTRLIRTAGLESFRGRSWFKNHNDRIWTKDPKSHQWFFMVEIDSSGFFFIGRMGKPGMYFYPKQAKNSVRKT